MHKPRQKTEEDWDLQFMTFVHTLGCQCHQHFILNKVYEWSIHLEAVRPSCHVVQQEVCYCKFAPRCVTSCCSLRQMLGLSREVIHLGVQGGCVGVKRRRLFLHTVQLG